MTQAYLTSSMVPVMFAQIVNLFPCNGEFSECKMQELCRIYKNCLEIR